MVIEDGGAATKESASFEASTQRTAIFEGGRSDQDSRYKSMHESFCTNGDVQNIACVRS